MNSKRKIDYLNITIEKRENKKEMMEYAEHIEIYKIIKKREKTPLSKAIPLEKVLKEYI